MNMKEITQALKSLGWSIRTDEVGDKSALFALPDRVAWIVYVVRKYQDDQQLGATLSLTTDAFSEACSKIRGERPSYYPLARAWKGLRIRVPEVLKVHVREVSDEAIAWAKEQDLDKALQEHAALPTDAPGARPIWHLAALALLGDVAKLKSYQASFETGNRLGFVNYITKDCIDRALAAAEEHAAET